MPRGLFPKMPRFRVLSDTTAVMIGEIWWQERAKRRQPFHDQMSIWQDAHRIGDVSTKRKEMRLIKPRLSWRPREKLSRGFVNFVAPIKQIESQFYCQQRAIAAAKETLRSLSSLEARIVEAGDLIRTIWPR
jgi:hypothetical protein